jgi:hypothetical protein
LQGGILKEFSARGKAKLAYFARGKDLSTLLFLMKNLDSLYMNLLFLAHLKIKLN